MKARNRKCALIFLDLGEDAQAFTAAKKNTSRLFYLSPFVNICTKNVLRIYWRIKFMYDVTAIGELLIDFTPEGTTPEGTVLYGRNPGGGPPNVLSAMARLGGRTALISKVGDDRFGKFLISVMKDVSVETRGIRVTDKANTTLAFVHLDSSGDRSFSFCRKPGADMLLSDKDVDRELVAEARVFHFSTVSMTHEPSRSATLYAVRIAKENGALISFDPNLRPPLWDGLEEARQMIIKGLG